METVLLSIILVLLAGLIAIAILLLRRRPNGNELENQTLFMLQNQINEVNRTLDLKLGELPKVIQGQFGESAKIIRDVTERLVKLDETNKQVINFADQLQNLQDILKNPKQRGVLGEYYLKTVLENVLPPGIFEMQYKFKDGTVVDAAIFVKDKIIPVDSKFSLENYNRILLEKDENARKQLESVFREDLKNRIDETAKYIKPAEDTMDFAFMFIPAEAVYYDLLINKVGAIKSNTRDLIEYAAGEKKVIIVSPTTFLAYLQTVLQGLKALQIEESAKEIMKRVQDLGRHLVGYEEYMKKLGNHLGTSVNAYNHAYRELGKIDKDVLRITGELGGIEPVMLNVPEQNEEQ
jgi:DNA recombination protein RmuC